MPRLKPADDFAQDNGSRRSSGRTRKPTAKIEALAGTKFFPSDPAKGGRVGSTSLSPGPSANSSFSTPISPQSDSLPRGSQAHTSPSTISVQVASPNHDQHGKQAPSTPASDTQTPNQASTHSLRRERKPTQRALEMTESVPKPRRRRRTQAEMAAARASATPSEISSAAEIESPTTDRRSSPDQSHDVPSTPPKAALPRAASRARKSGKESNEPSSTLAEDVSKTETAFKPTSRGRKKDLLNLVNDSNDPVMPPFKKGKPTSRGRKKDLLDVVYDSDDSVMPASKKARPGKTNTLLKHETATNGHNSSPTTVGDVDSAMTRQSRRTSTQHSRAVQDTTPLRESMDNESLSKSRPEDKQKGFVTSPEPGTKSLRLKLSTRRSGRVAIQPEAETPKRRARSSAVNYKEPDFSAHETSSDETVGNAHDISKSANRTKRSLPVDAEPLVKKVTPASPGARRLRLRQPDPPAADPDAITLEDSDGTDPTQPKETDTDHQSQADQRPPVVAISKSSRKRQASPPEEERPRKSLKLKLKVPGLKAPSKLRFSINSQDLSDSSPSKPSTQVRANPAATAANKNRQGSKLGNSVERAAPPEQPVQAEKSGPAPKLSRRAQAKAEAKALGKIRQATESANHDRLYDTTYGGAASHYAPSMSLVRPAVDCALFCLPEPSRILAFAKIAAQSIESDDEETSDGGRQPELLTKWLQKGGEHCVCNKSPHVHEADADAASEDQSTGLQQEPMGISDEAVQNADVAAAIPDTIHLPLEIPPVNSIMPKSQGRRVSAFYNVLTGSPTPTASNTGSSASGSRHQSRATSTAKVSASPSIPAETTSSFANASTTARPRTGSYEERMRWDHQALERVRRDAKEAGPPVTVDMTYPQIKTQLEQHREQRSASGSEGTNTPTQSHAPGHRAGLSAKAVGKLPESVGGAGRQHNTYNNIEDDTEDRLLQIIGESFKATMKRNKSASVESPATTDSQFSPLGVRARS